MQVILEPDEAATVMSAVTSKVIDQSGISQDGKQAIRRWRGDRPPGSVPMGELTEAINGALASLVDTKTNRTVRRKGRHMSSREVATRRRG